MNNKRKEWVAPENTGTIFPNLYKKSEKHPDFKGSINIAGVQYELAGWNKQSQKTGADYLSIKVSLPEDKQETPL